MVKIAEFKQINTGWACIVTVHFFIITAGNILSYGLRKLVKLHVLCLFTQYKVAKEDIFMAVLHPKS